MIVYGDPQFKTTSAEFLESLRQCASSASSDDLDELRSCLIQGGQLEQAIEDSPSHETATAYARGLTDLAAAAFYAAWARTQKTVAIKIDMGEGLEAFRHGLRLASEKPDRKMPSSTSGGTPDPTTADETITVKIPEGFAFYALYPEQYCLAAFQWHACNSKITQERKLLVVGIRSIGTSLSALVSAALKCAGWLPMRITVRPSGPPFERTTMLPARLSGCASRAIVVDEGPGLSGSSMASVAKALTEIGFAPEQISFFPGHAGEPGTAATDQVRQWWSRVRRYVTAHDQLRWNELTLAESLLQKSSEIAKEKFCKVEDLSCGRWREKVYQNKSAWPWAPIPFERMKFLCTAKSGASILWKFTGLHNVPQIVNRSEYTLSPLRWFHGFVAFPWIDGTPLSIADGCDPEIVRQIGQHIAAISKPPLSPSDQLESVERIRHMLYWNTQEAFGNGMANNFSDPIPCPAYGDGRLAPHEWIRSRTGQITKVDAMGHNSDHTIVGRQPIYWDIAGAMVEWQLHSPQLLLASLEECGIVLKPDVLKTYQMAYAAFRMGQASLCAQAGDADEAGRAQEAFGNYRAQLRELLLP
jgi:hypothetical protein